jgi:riboflavin kinase, archaea type
LDKPARLNGVIFSDLGQAPSFMALEWVQRALEKTLGFVPYPATLNVRPQDPEDARVWQAIQKEVRGIPLSPTHEGFCSARIFPVAIQRAGKPRSEKPRGAVLLPEVTGYPHDKIEIVAAVRLKDELNLDDGDQLTLEFVN